MTKKPSVTFNKVIRTQDGTRRVNWNLFEVERAINHPCLFAGGTQFPRKYLDLGALVVRKPCRGYTRSHSKTIKFRGLGA